MHYVSTRGFEGPGGSPLNFTDILLSGTAPDGGLYVPVGWPTIPNSAQMRMHGLSYDTIATQIMKPFVGDAFDEATLNTLCVKAYENFRHKTVAPLIQIGPNAWLMELFHGPTLAFKDVAMQFLGHAFDAALEKKGQKITIIGATSGDTGSAAIEAFKNKKNINLFMLHPAGRVSEVQRKQMTTVDDNNIHNIAIDGSFDDCQAIVKTLFNDKKLNDACKLSAVNSINWARIMAQIVYYAFASLSLGAPDRAVSFAVPTGNFGNVFAAYVARRMGFPIKKLIIGSNQNDILTRFFASGEMKKGDVVQTLSPSMDIQISSNFERLLFDLLDREPDRINKKMDSFRDTGLFRIDPDKLVLARSLFDARRVNDDMTRQTIKMYYNATGLIIDPHTAVGIAAAEATYDDPATPVVALGCAHPAKFPDAIESAIGIRPTLPDFMADLMDRAEHVTPMANDATKVRDFIIKNSD